MQWLRSAGLLHATHKRNLHCNQGNWSDEVKRAWRIDPRLVVFMPERFKSVVLEMEVAKYTRAHTRNVLDVPEALHFITGDRLNSATLRDLKVSVVF